jgi:hypothetical protein
MVVDRTVKRSSIVGVVPTSANQAAGDVQGGFVRSDLAKLALAWDRGVDDSEKLVRLPDATRKGLLKIPFPAASPVWNGSCIKPLATIFS